MTCTKAATPTTEHGDKGRTPVRPVKLNGAKLKPTATKTQTAAKAEPQITSNFIIPYNDAVKEGRDLVKQLDRNPMRLGELAARVETKYGDRTLAKFAKAIGACPYTLKRYRSVYKAYEGMGIGAPGPLSAVPYTRLRDLQNHPDRKEIFEANPKITQREALDLKREHEGKIQKSKSGDWREKETKRCLRWIKRHANEGKRIADEVRRKELVQALRQIMEPKLLPTLRANCTALLSLVDQLEHQDEHIEEAEREDLAA